MAVVLHYSTDLQVVVTCIEMQQCPIKGSVEEDCMLVNIDVNNTGFKLLWLNWLFKCFMENAPNTLVNFKDKHNVFRCVTLNVNMTFVCLQENSSGHISSEKPAGYNHK